MTTPSIASLIAKELAIPLHQVTATVTLLDDGNTIPFVARYRKEVTGGLDEEQIRAIQVAVTKARQLLDRKQTVLKSIDSQGRLSEELARRIAYVPQIHDGYLGWIHQAALWRGDATAVQDYLVQCGMWVRAPLARLYTIS